MSAVTYGDAIKAAIARECPSYHLPKMDQETAERKIQDYSGAVGSFFLWQNPESRECHFTGIGSQGEIHHARLTKDSLQWTAENWNTITTSMLPHAIAGVLGSPKIFPVMPMGMDESKPVEETKNPAAYEMKV